MAPPHHQGGDDQRRDDDQVAAAARLGALQTAAGVPHQVADTVAEVVDEGEREAHQQ
jgi:hypothetical protein